MPEAIMVIEAAQGWAPTTHIYQLSEPFNGHEYVGVTVSAFGTAVVPSTPSGVGIADPSAGLVAHRQWFPPIDHVQALAELGFTFIQEAL